VGLTVVLPDKITPPTLVIVALIAPVVSQDNVEVSPGHMFCGLKNIFAVGILGIGVGIGVGVGVGVGIGVGVGVGVGAKHNQYGFNDSVVEATAFAPEEFVAVIT
jgi:hypothetical protein